MRIAVAQAPGAPLSQWRSTLDVIDDLVSRACARGAELILLPECAWPAYDLGSPDAYRAARAAGMPGPTEFLDRLRQAARAQKTAICAGYVEERDAELCNAAVLIDAAGEVRGVHRKCFLWDFDHELYAAGRELAPVETPFGRVGLMICADARLPEIPATLASRGAELILQPTGWVNVGTAEQPWNPQPAFMIAARATEFGVPVASASKWGPEGRATFVGSSLICGADGQMLTQCATDQTEVRVADVELRPARRPRVSTAERSVLTSPNSGRMPAADVPVLQLVLRGRDDRGQLEAAGAVPLTGKHGVPVSRASGAVLRLCPPAHRAKEEPWTAGEGLLAVDRPWTGIALVRNVGVAAVSADDARPFAPLRCRSLLGAHVAVVLGDGVSAGLLRTRAAENRIFIIHAGSEDVRVFDPRGQPAWTGPWPAHGVDVQAATLDVKLAADKEFAPHTHLVRGRRPAQYEL